MSFKKPKEIALELVPRSLDGILTEAKESLNSYPFVTSINVPEIRRLPIKSFEPTELLLQNKVPTTPHFRVIDRTEKDLIEKIAKLIESGLKQVLIIGGDPPKDDSQFTPSGLSTLSAVKAIKREFPNLKIYTGLDPYRSSFREELDYAYSKQEAGSDGFYTQPIFSIGLLEQWQEQLPDAEIWFGITPVLTEKSRRYWERVNKVVLPSNFRYDLEYNIRLARQLLVTITEMHQRGYLMPISNGALDYLQNIFE
jgi:methylenetetrahydrofolate reductase (NADPH)